MASKFKATTAIYSKRKYSLVYLIQSLALGSSVPFKFLQDLQILWHVRIPLLSHKCRVGKMSATAWMEILVSGLHCLGDFPL